jgi:hypothetical protein
MLSMPRVHDVQRHLHGVEREPVLGGDGERVEVNARILVAGEPDEPQLAGLPRLDERAVRAFLVEDAMRVLVSKHLVMLHEIDTVGPPPPERFVELARGFFFRAAVDLRHQERLLTIAVGQRLSHAPLARTLVVVPAVVEKRDAFVEGAADDADAEIFGHRRKADVRAAEADRGNTFTGTAEQPVRHLGHSASNAGRLCIDRTLPDQLRLPTADCACELRRLTADCACELLTASAPAPHRLSSDAS